MTHYIIFTEGKREKGNKTIYEKLLFLKLVTKTHQISFQVSLPGSLPLLAFLALQKKLQVVGKMEAVLMTLTDPIEIL